MKWTVDCKILFTFILHFEIAFILFVNFLLTQVSPISLMPLGVQYLTAAFCPQKISIKANNLILAFFNINQ